MPRTRVGAAPTGDELLTHAGAWLFPHLADSFGGIYVMGL